MSNKIPRNKFIIETFIEDAMLTEEEEKVLRTRVAGWPRSKQASEYGMSMSTLDRIIRRVKDKYDLAARYNPKLPPRKTSELEKWMDEN